MSPRPWILLAVTAALSLPAPAADGGVGLLKGTDPRQFLLVGIGPEALAIADGEIRLTGRPAGYFATREAYHNYQLSFEWMYERPPELESEARFRGNSGLLVHIAEPHKVWPRCVEVQLMNADAGNVFALNGATFQGEKLADAQRRAVKPVGQWNRTEVACQDGRIACTINGTLVARGSAANPDRGPIGWQSQGQPIRFRGLTIKQLD